MVNIDTVYQKVLALCNKEQRGYMTPQEFNLLADKAQNEIFDSYFHDIKTAYHKPKNQMGAAFDEIEILQEKLDAFQVTVEVTAEVGEDGAPAVLALPGAYFLNVIKRADTNVEVNELTPKEIVYTQNNPLTAATLTRMVYVRASAGTATLYPVLLEETDFIVDYYARPVSPEWAYVVVKKRALYNNSNSINFILHASEEEVLVSRILQLAGVVIMKPGLVEVGAAEKASIKAEQNN